MTSPYLTDDCIYHILRYLQGYHYRSTLFKCGLVNRFWCRAAIPLLYANPFFFRPNKKYYLIILTLISCFNKEEILQLKNKIKFNINDEYKPLFEYPKYFKSYDCDSANHKIIRWINHFSNPNDKILECFCLTFHHTILKHCVNIEQFNISINYSLIKFNLNFNISISNLIKLNSLALCGLKDLDGMEFLSNIANHCLNLKELKMELICISHPEIQEKLCTIIQRQNSLEKLKISRFALSDNIFSSLEFQTHSLVSIVFSYINFSNISFKNFINLNNLNTLEFFNCGDTNPLNRYEILKFASFKLKRLKFFYNTWNENIEPTIIKYLGPSLKSLSLFEKSITIPVIRDVSMYCLNLLILKMIIVNIKNIDSLVFPYFKNLKIRKLDINIYGILCENMKNNLMKLANNISINVEEISLWFSGDKLQPLKIFLEHCHNYLKKISLKFGVTHFLSKPEFSKLILNYIDKSNNSLKILKIGEVERILNNEDLSLLGEIIAKGIKILVY
ncbi:hypothetical protein GLOIN_2v1774869 [Rhizophagus clarus]|uniref:F-box domain-containing protein n=1 Tax=Rhizophagus clarus TaxID=94130 RepID=A0A8H3QE53_9GLOM|nr:hypothetical protein GLOIN_2v1774869 [Rhizophagus clarus]